MKYKGFWIEAQYYPGSDFRIDKHDRVIERKPTAKDRECYRIEDPMINMSKHGSFATINECKQDINELLILLKMKSNSPQEWAKL